MADETKSETNLETKSEENFFDIFESAPVKPEPPVEPEPSADEFEGHEISSNESGEVFIAKDGQCLGVAAGVFKNEEDLKSFVSERAKS